MKSYNEYEMELNNTPSQILLQDDMARIKALTEAYRSLAYNILSDYECAMNEIKALKKTQHRYGRADER